MFTTAAHDNQLRVNKIASLKDRLRSAVIGYRVAVDQYDCGANTAAVINPNVSRAARQINQLARELKELDPTFPASWKPYPEGT